MDHDLHCHIVHVSGTRMIAQGTDGLSRGNMLQGVFTWKQMQEFVPLHLNAGERSPKLISWVKGWYPNPDLHELTHVDWFDAVQVQSIHHCLWVPAPASAETAIEQLCYTRLKRPQATHVILVPRLLTLRWRKQLSKTSDLILTINCGPSFWDTTQHEPLLISVCFPLMRYKPWRLQGTPFLERAERSVREVQAAGERGLGTVLHELFVQARALESLPKHLVRQLLQG